MNGWRMNRINAGPPYRVEIVGPYQLAHVCDLRGIVAMSTPGGAVFCADEDEAVELCRLANAGELEQA